MIGSTGTKKKAAQAQGPSGPFTKSASRGAFLAALSVYAASGAVAQTTPLANPGDGAGLQFDFRCEGPGDCPLADPASTGTTDPLTFAFPSDPGYLQFRNATPTCPTGQGVSNTVDGVGVTCTAGNFFEGDPGPGAAEAPLGLVPPNNDPETLEISVCSGDPATAASCSPALLDMQGIYITSVDAETFSDPSDGTFCESDAGVVEVFYDDAGTPDSFDINWQAPTDGGEGSGECAVDGEQTIFVPFFFLPDDAQVQRITVSVDTLLDPADGVYVLGTEDCSGGQATFDGKCEFSLYEDIVPFPDGDLRIRATAEAEITLVPGFPFRVQDTRAICQAGADLGAELPEPLIIDGSTIAFTVEGDPVDSSLLPLGVDSATAPTEIFTVSDKTCGIPRANSGGSPDPFGDPVERDGTAGTDWTPFVDVVSITAEFDPIADTTEFFSSDLDFEPGSTTIDGPYACQTPEFFLGEADEDQPLFEINARPEEIKYVMNMAGTPAIDPVGRDIMTGCGGSKRGISRRWSYLAYNMIHVPNVDFVAETREELDTLIDTVNRLQSCVNGSFYYGELVGRVSRADRYYSIFERYRDRSERIAERYLSRARSEIFGLRFVAEDSRSEFGTCWTTEASNFVEIRATSSPDPTDKPLNAFGDIVSQALHLTYVIGAFEDKLLGR